MDYIEMDIEHMSKLVPNLDPEEIVNYLKTIPESQRHLKVALAMRHLFQLEERKTLTDTSKQNESDSIWIHSIFPEYSIEKILKKLKKYGNNPGRTQYVFKCILRQKETILTAMAPENEANHMLKRKSPLDADDHITLVKVLKTETSLIEKNDVQRGEEVTNLQIQNGYTFPSSSVIQNTTVNQKFELPETCDILHNVFNNKNADTESKATTTIKESYSDATVTAEKAPTEYPVIEAISGSTLVDLQNCPTFSVTESQCRQIFLDIQEIGAEAENIPSSKMSNCLKKTSKTERDNKPNNNKGKSKFDLITYLHEFTSKPKCQIKNYLKTRFINIKTKPCDLRLSVIVNDILNDSLEIVSSDPEMDDSSKDSDLELTEEMIEYIENPSPPTVNINTPTKFINHNLGPSTSTAEMSTTYNIIQTAGTSKSHTSSSTLTPTMTHLMEMFPDASTSYIRDLCASADDSDIDDLITKMLSVDYPKRPPPSPSPEVDLEEQLALVMELLPNADPSYLRMQCEILARKPDQFKAFIDNAVETAEYPTKKEYLRRQQVSAQVKQYTTEFSIENFVKIFPDPKKIFADPKRNVVMNMKDRYYGSCFLRNRFDKLTIKNIETVYSDEGSKLYRTCEALKKLVLAGSVMKCRRRLGLMPDTQNIPLLQEIAYLEHEEQILEYLENLKITKDQERLEAKTHGLMVTCSCCYDDEVLPYDAYNCPKGCNFCKDCIKKSTEILFSEGKIDFPCLASCGAHFGLQILKAALPPHLFSKLAQKKAVAEVKAAGIEDLESCPFCDFATIPSDGDKIFRCLNTDCMKESCRSCKEPSHVPLRCDEVEKDEDVQNRVFIENKMTEALLRKCVKCGVQFYKEEGCNKMTCSCGAKMCYLCEKPVTGYDHFNGLGGDKFHLCPLYSDTNAINQQNVLRAAEKAKNQLDGLGKSGTLKIDPTVGIQEHFKKRAKKLPREAHMDFINNRGHIVLNFLEGQPLGRQLDIPHHRHRNQMVPHPFQVRYPAPAPRQAHIPRRACVPQHLRERDHAPVPLPNAGHVPLPLPPDLLLHSVIQRQLLLLGRNDEQTRPDDDRPHRHH